MDNDSNIVTNLKDQVISIVAENIKKNYSSMDNRELAGFLVDLYMMRTKNHIALVNAVAALMYPAFERAGFTKEDYDAFLRETQHHDHDKLVNDAETIACQVLGSISKYLKAKDFFKASQFITFKYEHNVIPEHTHENVHHPESWAGVPRNGSGRPLLMSSFQLLGDPEVDPEHSVNPPAKGYARLAEMVCDWSAVGIELHDTTAKEWYMKWYNNKWVADDKVNGWMDILCTVAEEVTSKKAFSLPYDYSNLKWPTAIPTGPNLDKADTEGSKEALQNKTKVYYLSVWNKPSMKFSPRVPKNEFVDWGVEDGKTKRVCFCTSIDNCILAAGKFKPGNELVVYTTVVDTDKLIRPTKEQVPDINITHEVWYMNDVTVTREAKIRITDDVKKEYILKFKKNDGTEYVGHPKLYGYEITEQMKSSEQFETISVEECDSEEKLQDETNALFTSEVTKALKEFESFEYKCFLKDGSAVDNSDGRDIRVQTENDYYKHKAGMCHDATVAVASACNRDNVEHFSVYCASHDAPNYTTHSWVVAKNQNDTWSILDVYAKKHCFYKQTFKSAEDAITARMKLWIKLDNNGSNNADVFIRKDCPKGGVAMSEWTTSFVKGSRHYTAWKDSSIPEVANEAISTKVSNNIKNNKVYHSSPVKVDILTGKKSKTSDAEGSVFVSPYKWFSSMFVFNFQDIVDKIEEQINKKHIKIDNFGFREWNETPSSTTEIPKHVHVLVRTPENFKPLKGKVTGYLYTIDFNKYKDKTDMWSKASESDVEFTIHGDVEYEKCEEISYTFDVLKDTETPFKSNEVLSTDAKIKITELCQKLLKFDFNIVDYTKSPIAVSDGKNDDDFIKIYKLQPPEDTLKFKCGTCWDISLCAITELSKLGYKAIPVWFEVLNNDSKPNHMFVIIEDKTEYYIFEASMTSHGGVHGPFKSIEEVCGQYADWQNKTKDTGSSIVFHEIRNYPKSGTSYNDMWKLLQKEPVITTFSKSDEAFDTDTYFRITYDGIGIYEALKQNLSKEDWMKFLNSDAVKWLPKPTCEYKSGYQSYFTKRGYETFMVKTKQYMDKALANDKVHTETLDHVEHSSIVYSDEYQVVIDTKKGSSENSSIKDITFPPSEIDTLKKQDRIITTRVSADYNTFQKGDVVKTPWGDIFKISERLEISNIEDHPFYKELTKQQIAYLSKHSKIAVLTLIKCDSSSEAMQILNKTVDQKKLNALAKPLYNLTGQNSWEHIQQDVGNAVFLLKTAENRELTLKEYATILFHDCSVKSHPDKVKHSLISADIARPILKKSGFFTDEEIEEIHQAIVEHDVDMNPEMKFSTELSDLLASADFNPPNPAWILNKSWSWGIKHGLDYEERMNNTMSKIPHFYGSNGGAVYPALYTKVHHKEIKEMKKFFDNLTREECEAIIMNYREKHHLKETDIELPDPSEEVFQDSTTFETVSVEKCFGSIESIFNSIFKYFSQEEVNNTVSKWIFRYVEQTGDQLAIEEIDPTNLNKDLIQKFLDHEEECKTVLDWLTVPNYDLLPKLQEFGKFVDDQYGFKRAITVYRGIRSGLTFKHKQETMGLIDNTTFDNTLKEFTKRGYQFEFNPTGPMSVARSPWIAKIYGNVISKCQLPADTDKLVITAELAYALQKLQKEKYQECRAINMSCMMEIVVFPGKPTSWEVITTSGDISSELPQLSSSDATEDLLDIEELVSDENLKDMPTFKLTKNDDDLMKDKRYVRLLFMIKYVCSVNDYINPNSTFKELGITQKKYESLHNHIFKNYYLGDIKELPTFNQETKFKTFARWVIDHLRKVPKELIGTDPTKVQEESAKEALDVFKFISSADNTANNLNATNDERTKGLNDGLIENKYYQFSNFPYFLFVHRAENHYKTSRLEHMFQNLGNRTVKVHKFFIPELLYLLEELKFPQSMINDIYSGTWIGNVNSVMTKINTSLIDQNMTCTLYPHQKEFIENYPTLKDKNYLRGYLLSFEQGLGKTITSLALMEALGKEKVVIFCPKNTMRETWGMHIQTFFKQPQNVYYAYDKDMNDPSKRFYILNYEAIDKLDPKLFKNKKVGVIIDESHNFLRMSSDRTANLISFVKNIDSKDTDILPMSGTPIKCAGVEMIPMFYILDPLFDTDALQTFKLAFGFSKQIASDVLHHRLEHMMTRVTKDILNLPEKHETTLMVKMPTANRYTVRSVKLAIADFIADRQQYHEKMMSQYNKDFDACVTWLKNDAVGQTKEFQEWYETIVELSSGKNVTMFPKDWIGKINAYEKDVIIPELPLDLRKKFKDSRAAVKYLYLKIRGEVLGGLLTQMRQEMTSEMMQAANLESIVAESVKKTVIFTSYVDTIELVSSYFQKKGINCMSIYGKTAKELTENIKTFQTDPKVNPLIASLKMLSTGATLTAANTVIFLNKPWRSIEYDQASDRVHRIGQDTEVNIVSLVLDTGSEGNLSTRMEEIMNYSSELFDGIVEGEDLISNETFALLPRDTQTLLEYACEKLFITDKDLLTAVNSARPVNSKEQLRKQLRVGDLLIVYRSVKNPDYLVDSLFSPLAKRIQGSSFTSIKIVGPNDRVYGFGVKTGGAEFDHMSMKAFLETCPGVMVLRRPQPFTQEELDRLFAWFDERVCKIHYSVAKMWKSLVTHLGIMNKDTTTQEQAQKFMKPMFCSTILAYGFKAAGINDGITVNRDTVWPKDYILRSAFKPVIRYFKKEEDAEAVLAPWSDDKHALEKSEPSKESLSVFTGYDLGAIYDIFGPEIASSEEALKVYSKELRNKLLQARPLSSPEKVIAEAQPGDLVLTYRKRENMFDKVVWGVSDLITRSSFASIKIVDKDPNYVIGYGANPDTILFERVRFDSFLKTCNGVLLFRLPGGIPKDRQDEYFDYLHNRINSTYDTTGMLKSVVANIFGFNKTNTVTVESARNKKTWFCSTIFAYANFMCGINDGLKVDRKNALPIDFAINSNYRPTVAWFENQQEAEAVLRKAREEIEENGEISQETAATIFEIQNVYANEIFGCNIIDLTKEQYDLLTESEEKLFIKSKEIFDALSKGKPVSDRAELEKSLKPGDLLLVYRSYMQSILGTLKGKITSAFTKASFGSMKMVYKDPKYVIGFYAKMGDPAFRKVETRSFLETCNGVAVLRLPGGIPADKAKAFWSWIDDKENNTDYYGNGLIKSLFTRWNPFASKQDNTTQEEASSMKSHMFCSTIFAYGLKAAGINDGLNFNRDAVWPVDFATKSNFRCEYRYFAPGEGADEIFHDDHKDAEDGNPSSEETQSKESLDPFDISNEHRFIIGQEESMAKILKDLDEAKPAELSQEALTDAAIQKKKASILDKICKICDIIEPSGMNSQRYRQIIGAMNSKQFDSFIEKIKKGEWQLDLIVPNLKNKVTNENLLKAADAIDCQLMHRLWMRDEATGRTYLTDNEYMVLTLPIRRQQQFLDEKMSVPENDQKIDAMSGQVTGDDESCSITNPEIQILAARGLDRTLEEFVNIRGGNIHGYAEFRQALEETGEASLDSINPNFIPRISMVAEAMLKAMMLDNNITK